MVELKPDSGGIFFILRTMRPDRTQKSYNLNFFDKSIEGFANMDHELIQLSENIDWTEIEKSLEGHYCNYGRKAIETRLL